MIRPQSSPDEFPPGTLLSLNRALLIAAAWLALGVAGLVFLKNFQVVARLLFPLSSLFSVALTAVGLTAVVQNPQIAVQPIGLPDLPFHLRLDPLAAFFIMLLGAASAGISIFAAGYFRRAEGTPPGLLCLEYHVFLASMLLVLMADDAYVFMVMWETMALSSFFLVTTNHRIPEIRRAGFLYILVAHIGAIAILLCFGVLQANTGDYTFANMRVQSQSLLSPFWASAAFLLGLFGFGAKAGILPLHIWLPEAHPAAPSPVSALMSGVMLKTAVYGLLRVSLENPSRIAAKARPRAGDPPGRCRVVQWLRTRDPRAQQSLLQPRGSGHQVRGQPAPCRHAAGNRAGVTPYGARAQHRLLGHARPETGGRRR